MNRFLLCREIFPGRRAVAWRCLRPMRRWGRLFLATASKRGCFRLSTERNWGWLHVFVLFFCCVVRLWFFGSDIRLDLENLVEMRTFKCVCPGDGVFSARLDGADGIESAHVAYL